MNRVRNQLFGVFLLLGVLWSTVDAREAIKMPGLLVPPFVPKVDTFSEGCSVRINGDLSDLQPLIINPVTNNFLNPTTNNGIMTFQAKQEVHLFCNSGFSNPPTSATRLTAHCYGGASFSTQHGIQSFGTFACNNFPFHTVRRTGQRCANGQGILLNAGFDIGTNFLTIMELCHDEVNEVSLWSYLPMSFINFRFQTGGDRPSFLHSGFFNGKNLNTLYSNNNQVAMGTRILGSRDLALYYFRPTTTEQFLARGHLTARADMIFGSQQRGTFWFMNAAPQYQAFNGGNWESIESSTRWLFWNRNIVNGEQYTGTHGIMTLPDVNNVQRQIFLYFDENNNGLIPAPELYYKIIIDRATRSGIAIIGLNNIFLTEAEARQHIHCNDISDQISWIRWERTNTSLGYCYACEVNEFARYVGTLPDLDVVNILR